MNIELNGNVIVRHKSIPNCEWCDKAKALLEEKNIPYAIVDSDKWFFSALMKETKSRKVPQIIIKGKFVGDYFGLVEHLENDAN